MKKFSLSLFLLKLSLYLALVYVLLYTYANIVLYNTIGVYESSKEQNKTLYYKLMLHKLCFYYLVLFAVVYPLYTLVLFFSK
jgi:hypothetical protein